MSSGGWKLPLKSSEKSGSTNNTAGRVTAAASLKNEDVSWISDAYHLGGWKSPQTVLTVYQQPEMKVQREALASRKKPRVAG